jgi:diaminopimelate decarboxylase
MALEFLLFSEQGQGAAGGPVAFRFDRGEWRVGDSPMALSEFTRHRRRPFYFYNLDDAVKRAKLFRSSGAEAHFAMKSNSNPRLLKTFAALGLGADVTSLGELQKAMACGFDPGHIVFSGVGKDREDLEFAVRQGVGQINVESFSELKMLNEVAAECGRDARLAFRVNIHLRAPTHSYVQTANRDSKFGLERDQLPEALAFVKKNPRLKLVSLAVHIGSQIEDLSVFSEMGRQTGDLYRGIAAEGFALGGLDLGGGLGIDYKSSGEGDFALIEKYLKAIQGSHGTGARLSLEPGRILVARMGVLLAKVVHLKPTADQEFLILNAGMNQLMRPALYQSYHRIEALKPDPSAGEAVYTVVGPVCESTDKFASARRMAKVQQGDWVGIFDAGAYGATMANHFNENALPEEWTWLDGKLEVT